jgi:hypothetical protein
LWKAVDADTTLYLFGSLHVLPDRLSWRTPELDAALNEAQAVYFETEVEPDPAALSGLVARLGFFSPPDKLSAHLTPSERETVATAAGALAIPMYSLETMRPWLAGVSISQAVIDRAGFRSDLGVEAVLHERAGSQSKEIRRLETLEEQLRVLADLPDDVQTRFLLNGLSQMKQETALLQDLTEAWSRGDTDRIASIMYQSEAQDIPEVHQALILDRNRRWAESLETLSQDQAGTFLVVVGAGHLAGDESLLSLLTEKGLAISRIR